MGTDSIHADLKYVPNTSTAPGPLLAHGSPPPDHRAEMIALLKSENERLREELAAERKTTARLWAACGHLRAAAAVVGPVADLAYAEASGGSWEDTVVPRIDDAAGQVDKADAHLQGVVPLLNAK